MAANPSSHAQNRTWHGGCR